MKPIQLNEHPLLMQAYELSVEVDKLPAHTEQTDLIAKLGHWRDQLAAHLEKHRLLNRSKFVWIPEAPDHPGVYANESDDFDPTGSKIRMPGRQPSTMDASSAKHFATEAECKAWCDANPSPRFVPREHGFL